jgi:hypothetical protein
VTERKPRGEAFEDFVERQIREARERGELDHLPGEGRPLPFAGKPHDEARWLKEKLREEKLSVLPPALELRQEADRALSGLSRLRDEREVRRRLEELNDRIRRANRTSWTGPPTDLAPLDVEAWVERWRTGTLPDRAPQAKVDLAT